MRQVLIRPFGFAIVIACTVGHVGVVQLHAQQAGDTIGIKNAVRAGLFRKDSGFARMTEVPDVDTFHRDYKKCGAASSGKPTKCGIIGNKPVFIIDAIHVDSKGVARARVLVVSPERDSLAFAFSSQEWSLILRGGTWVVTQSVDATMSGLMTTDH